MLKKGEQIEGIPTGLKTLLDKDIQAKDFFDTLSKSYKKVTVIRLVLQNRRIQDNQGQKSNFNA